MKRKKKTPTTPRAKEATERFCYCGAKATEFDTRQSRFVCALHNLSKAGLKLKIN